MLEYPLEVHGTQAPLLVVVIAAATYLTLRPTGPRLPLGGQHLASWFQWFAGDDEVGLPC